MKTQNDLSSLNEMDHSSTFDLDSDDELDVDSSMFEPLYENASITVCGAYCAIMKFKCACRLPFTTIAMLLNILNLLCPPDNHNKTFMFDTLITVTIILTNNLLSYLDTRAKTVQYQR